MSLPKKIILGVLLSYISISISQENTFLQRDFWKSNPSIVTIDQLIKEGNAIAELNSNAFDAVVYSILENTHIETIKYILSKEGNDINKLTHDGRTYLFWAAYKNNQVLMQYLVEKGAKMNIIDDHGNTVLTFAASSGQTDSKLFDFLLANGATISETNKDGANALVLIAPHAETMEDLEYFISKGLPLNSKDNNGNGIFNYTARAGNIALLKEMIKQGLTPEGLNNEGGNAMLFAAQGTRGKTNGLEVYKYLESVGVKPNVTTQDGTTPLHILAYRNSDAEIFTYFIEKGVNINQKDTHGNTAFLNASAGNRLAILKFLVEKGAIPIMENKEGQNPLMVAVQNNTEEVVSFLLKENPVCKKDAKGNSLVYYLIEGFTERNKEGLLKKLEILQKEGLDLAEVQANGNTIYHLAIQKNSLFLLQKIIELQLPININKKNKEGLTPLHIAAMTGKDDTLIKYLLSKGASKTETTEFGETAFDLASENEAFLKNNIQLKFLQ